MGDADAVHRRMLACLVRLGVPEFVERFLTLAARQFLGRHRNLDPVSALSLLPSDRAAAAVKTLAGAGRHEEAVAFVGALVERERREVATAGAEVLADRELHRWAGATEVEAVLRILWELDAGAAAERFLARALATCTAERLLPVALSLAPTAGDRPGWDTLCRACVAHVLHDAGPCPPPPADLARRLLALPLRGLRALPCASGQPDRGDLVAEGERVRPPPHRGDHRAARHRGRSGDAAHEPVHAGLHEERSALRAGREPPQPRARSVVGSRPCMTRSTTGPGPPCGRAHE